MPENEADPTSGPSPAGRFCTICGTTNTPESNFCANCHNPLKAPMYPPIPPPPPPAHQAVAGPVATPPIATEHPAVREARARSRLYMIVVIVIAVGVVIVLFLVPLPLPFYLNISNPGSVTEATCDSYTFDANAGVSFSWSTTDGATVSFTVVDSAHTTIYSEDTSSGSGSFTANGGTYQFCMYDWAADHVGIRGTASQPIL